MNFLINKNQPPFIIYTSDQIFSDPAGTLGCQITSCSMQKYSCVLAPLDPRSDPITGSYCFWGDAIMGQIPVKQYPTTDLYMVTTDPATGAFDLYMRGDISINYMGGVADIHFTCTFSDGINPDQTLISTTFNIRQTCPYAKINEPPEFFKNAEGIIPLTYIDTDIWGDNNSVIPSDSSDDPNFLKSDNPQVPREIIDLDPGNFHTNQTRPYDSTDPKQMYFEFTEYLLSNDQIPGVEKVDFLNSQWENSPCNVGYRIHLHPSYSTDILLIEPAQNFDYSSKNDESLYSQKYKDHYEYLDLGAFPAGIGPEKIRIYPKQGYVGRYVFRLQACFIVNHEQTGGYPESGSWSTFSGNECVETRWLELRIEQSLVEGTNAAILPSSLIYFQNQRFASIDHETDCVYKMPRWQSTDPIGLEIDYVFIDKDTNLDIGINANTQVHRKLSPYSSGYLIYDMIPTFHRYPDIIFSEIMTIYPWWEKMPLENKSNFDFQFYVKGTVRNTSITFQDPILHRFTCNCHETSTEVFFRKFEKENHDVVFDQFGVKYKYEISGLTTKFTDSCLVKYYATDISIISVGSPLSGPNWEGKDPSILSDQNPTEAEDCHTLPSESSNEFCKYININTSLDERIIVFYVWYEIHSGLSNWNGDHTGIKKVFSNYGWVTPLLLPDILSQTDIQIVAQPIQISINCESTPFIDNLDLNLGLKDTNLYLDPGVQEIITFDKILCSMSPCINMKCIPYDVKIQYIDNLGITNDYLGTTVTLGPSPIDSLIVDLSKQTSVKFFIQYSFKTDPATVLDKNNCDETLIGTLDSGYRGCQTKTRSGNRCIAWNVDLCPVGSSCIFLPGVTYAYQKTLDTDTDPLVLTQNLAPGLIEQIKTEKECVYFCDIDPLCLAAVYSPLDGKCWKKSVTIALSLGSTIITPGHDWFEKHPYVDPGLRQTSFDTNSEHNYCRNPNSKATIWCNINVSPFWEYCDPKNVFPDFQTGQITFNIICKPYINQKISGIEYKLSPSQFNGKLPLALWLTVEQEKCLPEIKYKFFKDSACSIIEPQLSTERSLISGTQYQYNITTNIIQTYDFISYLCPYFQIEQQGNLVVLDVSQDIVPNPVQPYQTLKIDFKLCGLETITLITEEVLKYNLRYDNKFSPEQLSVQFKDQIKADAFSKLYRTFETNSQGQDLSIYTQNILIDWISIFENSNPYCPIEKFSLVQNETGTFQPLNTDLLSMDSRTNVIYVNTKSVFPNLNYQDNDWSKLNTYYSIHLKAETKYSKIPFYIPLRIMVIQQNFTKFEGFIIENQQLCKKNTCFIDIRDNDLLKKFVLENKYKFCSEDTNRFDDKLQQIFLTIVSIPPPVNSTTIKTLFNYDFIYRDGSDLLHRSYDCIKYFDNNALSNNTSNFTNLIDGVYGQKARLDYFNSLFKTIESKEQGNSKTDKEYKNPGLEFVTNLINGDYRFDFTETMYKLEEIFIPGRNLTLFNEFKDLIFNVTFQSQIDINNNLNSSIVLPEIENWKFKEFTQFYVDLEINFTQPLIVSQTIIKDTIQLEIYHQRPFKALRSGYNIPLNYTTKPCDVLSQPLEEDKELIQILTISLAASVIISIIIPLIFMICMKFSMDKAWHFYLMLQVLSNIQQFNILVIPASAQTTIYIIAKISSFKIMEEPLVKSWIKYAYDYQSQSLREFMFNQGTTFIVVLSVILSLLFYVLIKCIKQKSQLATYIKNKVMWKPILRSQIQFYLLTGITTLRYFQNVQDEENQFKTIYKVIQITLLILLPIFSFFIIHHHRNELIVEKYQILYGPLYMNLYYRSQSVFFWIPLFCAARFSLAISTAILDDSIIPCVISLFTWSIVQMKFHYYYKPMTDHMLNLQERFYQIVIYFFTYFMFIFSTWINDTEFVYEMGWKYMQLFIIICIISFILIIIDLYQQMKKRNQLKKIENIKKQQEQQNIDELRQRLELKLAESFKRVQDAINNKNVVPLVTQENIENFKQIDMIIPLEQQMQGIQIQKDENDNSNEKEANWDFIDGQLVIPKSEQTQLQLEGVKFTNYQEILPTFKYEFSLGPFDNFNEFEIASLLQNNDKITNLKIGLDNKTFQFESKDKETPYQIIDEFKDKLNSKLNIDFVSQVDEKIRVKRQKNSNISIEEEEEKEKGEDVALQSNQDPIDLQSPNVEQDTNQNFKQIENVLDKLSESRHPFAIHMKEIEQKKAIRQENQYLYEKQQRLDKIYSKPF